MDYSELLFKENESSQYDKYIKKKLCLINKKWIYSIKADKGEFTGKNVSEIINVINYCAKINKFNYPLVFNLPKVMFCDKLSYVMLEIIYYHVTVKNKMNIAFNFKPIKSIYTEGILFSPLNEVSDFEKKFVFDLNMRHFRRLVPKSTNANDDTLSSLMQDLNGYFINNGIGDEVSNQLSEVFSELVGNAYEHGGSDCLIDVDVTNNNYYKECEPDNQCYYGLNAVILNFSNTLFHESLKMKLQNVNDLPERYLKVNTAKQYHLKHLNDNYFENDFYTLSSFQHKISGSDRKNATGGTGLTRLINSLEEKVDNHYCYMISGKRILYFTNGCLKFDKDKFIGFNDSNDYMTSIPNKNIFATGNVFIPGTAYNLSFAIKKGWNL